MNKRLCRIVVSFLQINALADLLTGDSALLLYFSESKTISRNYITVPIFQNLSFFMYVFYCVNRKHFGVLQQ